MSFDFAANTLQELTSGSAGPWITFAVKTAPNAAVLAFTFVLLLAILFSLLIWCAGNPKRMLLRYIAGDSNRRLIHLGGCWRRCSRRRRRKALHTKNTVAW
jgi:hypothetical protein